MSGWIARRLGVAVRLGIACVALSATGVSAENHALLVGVSAYPKLDARMQLQGSANDVALMREVLMQKNFAPQRIVTLAEGVPGAADPTRANILAAFDRLANGVKAGDFVYLHFSGHGSQQPSQPGKSPPEPDGRDEIFLPKDIGEWNDTVGAVENALVDSEMNVVVSRLRKKGAFVWVVFDSCHSGTMTRGAGSDEIRYRQVTPDAFKIPDRAFARAEQDAVKSRGKDVRKGGAIGDVDEKGQGGFVAFYAAQTVETTPELPMPQGESGRKPHGLFSYVMAETIQRYGGITYKQLAQQILQRYAALGMNSTTPLFEGSGTGSESALNARVFGIEAQDEVRQWPLRLIDGKVQIAAGRLNQFGDGAIFALVPTAASPDKETIGYLRADTIAPLATTLSPVAQGDTAAPDAARIRPGQYLRLVDPGMRLNLRVALPPAHGKSIERDRGVRSAQSGACKPLDPARKETAVEQQARKLIEEMRDQQRADTRIEWVAAGQEADLRLLVAGDRIWLLPPNGLLVECGSSRTPSVALDGNAKALRDSLESSFRTIAKATNLMRLAGMMGASPVAEGQGLKVGAKLVRSGGEAVELDFVQPPEFREGDRVKFVFTNNGRKAKDLTVLFVDSRYGIAAMFPSDDQPVNRIETPGKVETEFVVDASTTGIERLVVIAMDAEKLSERADFSFLAQPALRDAATRGAGFNLRNLFDEAGFGVRTRGLANARAPLGAADFRVFSWRVDGK